MVPVMLSEGHHKRGISLTRIAALAAGNAARAMGLSHCKGAISVGLDADFAVVDLNAEWTLDASCLRSSAGFRSMKAAGSRDEQSTQSCEASSSCVIENWMTRL
jgi:dihydroorotase-like cyclic amidohydrolase